MSNKTNSSILSPSGRLFFAGLVAMTMLAARLQGQFVSTVVSNGLNSPYGVAVDNNNNAYIADSGNNRIALYNFTTQTLSTLAGLSGTFGTNNGSGSAARFNTPQGIVYVPGRGGLVVVDQANSELRLVTLGGVVTTLATTGVQLSYPKGIALAKDGLTLYVADQGNDAIRVVSPGNVISTLATTYTYNSTTYTFRSPAAVAVDNQSNIWATDSLDHVLCKISPAGVAVGIAGTYRTAGTNDSLTAANALFNLPSGLLWDNARQILVISDTDNDTIRGLYVTNAAYAVQTLAGLPGVSGFVNGSLSTAEFFHPFGLCNDADDNGYFVVDGGNGALRVLQPTQPPAAPQPIDSPIIGYVSFPIVNNAPSAQFNAIDSPIATFNNAVDLAIEQPDGSVDTYMSYGATGTVIPPPGVGTDFAAVFTPADEGLLPDQVPDLDIPTIPALTLEAISLAPGRPASPAVSVEIQFITANPNIIGDDAADIVLSNNTVGAQMFYTLDGTTPTNTGGGTSIGPITTGTTLSLNLVSNITLLTVGAFANGFAPSGLVTEVLNITNAVGNQLTWGFANGIGSTKFITAAGRHFYAPVTLTELPATAAAFIYSLQFDLTESGGAGPGIISPASWDFQTMLDVKTTNTLNPYVNLGTNGVDLLNGTIQPTGDQLVTTNNLMELAWITVPPSGFLYPTTNQDLTAFSSVHGYLFEEAVGGQVIVGDFSFPIPANPAPSYTLQALLPSATTFAVNTGVSPPIGVSIQAPTYNTTGPGTLNGIKQITVQSSISYLIGDAYPFRWYNVGDFGDSDLADDDVLEVYESAIAGVFTPPANSDFYDAMDSWNGTGLGAYNLYSASDSVINTPGATGDGVLDVSDVYVTLRRSLDTNLIWYNRVWSNGTASLTTFTNFPLFAGAPAPTNQISPGAPRYIAVAGGQVQAGGSSFVQVPISIVAADSTYPVRVFMLNVEVDPLDGSPPINSQVSISSGANLSAPNFSSSTATNNSAAAWLDSTVTGVSGTNVLVYVNVTLPSNVTPSSAYLVHVTHFSASPNGLALFVPTLQDGLITVGNRTGSSWNDGIPDTWRLLWFGTVSNALSAATADPDGDGANNWQEFVAGTNPNDPASVFEFLPGSTLAPSSFSLSWTSVPNKRYTVQTSYTINPGNWTTIATNILGTGQPIQWTDRNATGKNQFYRAFVQ
jgi:sugar lactone lactonase YvrE